MSEQTNFISRVGKWFRRDPAQDGNGAVGMTDVIEPTENGEGMTPVHHADVSRSMFLRPWAKRDAAITNLQEGFNALTGLMIAVKDGLEKQAVRQDELLSYMAHLPGALESIPQSSRATAQTLEAISEQMKSHGAQQARLGEILERVTESSGGQKEILQKLNDRFETLSDHDQSMASSLNSVGQAMQSVSQTSQSSAQILEQMRDTVRTQESDIQKLIQKQNVRFTTMLAISLFLAVGAIVAVSVVGYLLMTRVH
jgi:methyl-accepting chemotaxis protein